MLFKLTQSAAKVPSPAIPALPSVPPPEAEPSTSTEPKVAKVWGPAERYNKSKDMGFKAPDPATTGKPDAASNNEHFRDNQSRPSSWQWRNNNNHNDNGVNRPPRMGVRNFGQNPPIGPSAWAFGHPHPLPSRPIANASFLVSRDPPSSVPNGPRGGRRGGGRHYGGERRNSPWDASSSRHVDLLLPSGSSKRSQKSGMLLCKPT